MQVWNLQTRLCPGPGRIISPIKIGEGSVSVGRARCASVSPVIDGRVTLAILGSRENDVLVCVEVGDGVFEVKSEINLPGWGGMIPTAAINIWQDATGRIFQGRL